MKSQQVVDYIAKQIKNGHSEAVLRKHLGQHGWPASAIDDAFARYYRSRKPLARAKRVDKKRQRRIERLKAFAALVVVVGLAAGVMVYLHRPKTVPVVQAAPEPTYAQRQSIDVNTIGGAIGQYTVANNGILPTRFAVGASDRSLIMCNAACDPTNSQISALSVYKAQNVKLMTYVADLAAPDEQTLYLVPGATCKDRTTLGPPSVSARAMVILYASSNGSTISQRCVKL